LKYDLFEEIESLMMSNPNKKKCKWSLFEWSQEPNSLDFLSFSGFFVSLKCFRLLLLSGFVMNDEVACHVICSGSLELYNLVSSFNISSITFLHEASRFAHLSLVEYLMNQKGGINSIDLDILSF